MLKRFLDYLLIAFLILFVFLLAFFLGKESVSPRTKYVYYIYKVPFYSKLKSGECYVSNREIPLDSLQKVLMEHFELGKKSSKIKVIDISK